MINRRQNVLIHFELTTLSTDRQRDKAAQGIRLVILTTDVENVAHKLIDTLPDILHAGRSANDLLIQEIIIKKDIRLSQATNSLTGLVIQRVNLTNMRIVTPNTETTQCRDERVGSSIDERDLRVE